MDFVEIVQYRANTECVLEGEEAKRSMPSMMGSTPPKGTHELSRFCLIKKKLDTKSSLTFHLSRFLASVLIARYSVLSSSLLPALPALSPRWAF